MTKIFKFKYDTFNPYIYKQIPEGIKLLDLGCATGLLGKKIKQKKTPRFLAGVEKDKKMAKTANRFYDEIIVGDIEQINRLPFKKKYFDVIVASDILEHLKQPLTTLQKIIPYLKDNGFLLISVPNIAFIGIRLSLLFGRFDYDARGGLLDETHLKFFTKTGLFKLCQQAKLRITYFKGYALVRPRFLFLKILGWFFPTIFSLQFLIKAKKEVIKA